MRLHRLSVSAFGPYPGRVDIDLGALSRGGLFLLHGDTGAGKTTVLDAVAFALYGTVPGPRGQARRLRCDNARPDVPTEVVLELSVADTRVEIVRRPEYQRPKTRGSGLTTEKARVSLRHPADPAAPALSGHREVGDAVLELIGMSADQFFQVVLLPQGEFARFLRADTAEREKVLERLFDTERFARVEEIVAGMRRASAATVARWDREYGEALARWDEASGARADGAGADGADGAGGDSPDAGAPGLDRPVATGPVLDALRNRLARTAADADRARVERAAADAELAAAQRTADAVRQLRVLRDEHRRLQLDAPAIDELRAAVAAAERGLAVRDAARAATAAVAALGAARSTADGRRTALSVLLGSAAADTRRGSVTGDRGSRGTTEVLPREPDPALVRSRAAADRDAAGALAPLVEDADRLAADERGLLDLQDEAVSVTDELTTVEAEALRAQERLDALTGQLREAELAAGRLDALAAARGTAALVADAVRRIPAAVAAEQHAVQRRQDAVDEHQRQRDTRQQLVERRIAGMAGELAAALRGGDACPVCGSAEHPRPATAGDDVVGAEEIRRAEQRELRAESARRDTETQLLAVRDELRLLQATARDITPAGAQDALADAEQRWRDARTLASTVAPLTDERRLLDKQLSAAAARQRELTGRRAGLVGEIDVKREQIRARSSRVERAAAGHGSVRARRSHLLAVADARDGWADALTEVVAHASAAERAGQVLDLARAAAGFPTVEDALAAAALDLATARATVRRHEDELVRVTSRLEDPALAGVEESAAPDLAAVRQRGEQAAAVADAAAALRVRAAAVLAAAERAAVPLERIAAQAAPALAADAEIAALADTVAGRGQNHRAVSLRTFVLQTRLQQVAEVAGARLARMSSGRYSFQRSDGREGRRSGGLGLDILDAHTGVARPAKTLSGGESFLASLALALGLADVVAAESGGRVLDTIFIDEGFGTLDADVLELVMSTLDELRSGGRIVGLVSHLDDLQQRIPTRLHIRRGPGGPVPEVIAG